MTAARIFFFLNIACSVHGLSTVVFGTACNELQLLTSKLASREGIDTSCVCSKGNEESSYRLMYGEDYNDATKEEATAKMVSAGDEIGTALENADSLVLIGYDTPINKDALDTLLGATTSKLSKLVLLSKMGVTKAKGGFFGGGGSKELLESENRVRQIAKTKELDLSIVRAGILKGGGPGNIENDRALDKAYYNGFLDLLEFTMTKGHDSNTLGINDDQNGCAVTAGDNIEMPNMIAQMGTKSSFEPRPSDTNRIVLAGSIVAALLREDNDEDKSSPFEISVGTAKGKELPTMDEWLATLSKLS